MAEPTQITTHVADAKARLISQFKGKIKIEGFLQAMTQEYQVLEDVLWDMYGNRNLEDATGEQLDIIGEIVGTDREGRTDDAYRIRIIAKIGQNTSRGTGENILTVFNLLTDSTNTELVPYYSAHIMLTADHDITALDTDDIYTFTQLVCAAGVKLLPLAWTSDPADAFRFDIGLGFGDLSDPLVGGKFASLIP